MKIEIPTNCPSCSSKLDLVNGQLFCRNKSLCSAQSSKLIENFSSKMKLKGFGPQTIAKLEITKISELFFLTSEELVRAVGDKVAMKLLDELDTKLRGNVDFGQVLGSLSIPLIGEVKARALSQLYNDFQSVKAEGKAGEHLAAWKTSPSGIDVMELPWKFSKQQAVEASSEPKPSNGLVVCITGKLSNYKNRSEASAYLESLGYTVKSSVTKDVNILICEDETKRGSSSYKKAELLGIDILTIEQLLK